MIKNISVIVPVFNAEKTLRRCIDSILNQTYTDYELIIINDGSTDNSREICNEYVELDSRIKLFNQSNCGVSSARNLGISKATGNWICFIDSDDWIETDCFERCFDDVLGNIDLIMFSCKWAEDSRLPYRLCKEKNDFVDILPRFIDKITFVTPWCKLFKRNLINNHNIKFDNRFNSGEDTLFSFEYLTYVSQMLLLPYEGYHYVVNESDSTLSKIKNIDWEKQNLYFDAISKTLSILENKYDISMKKFRCLLGECILNKYLSSLSYFSIREVIKRIPIITDITFLDELFADKIIMPKGERRKLLDFFIKYRLFILLALYIKYIRAEY